MTHSRKTRLAAALVPGLLLGSAPLLGTSPAQAADTTTYLSSLPWSSATNGSGPVERDRSVGGPSAGDGKVLTLRGQTFQRGLGVHAASDVRFLVPAGCSRFSSIIGIDDAVGSKGSAVFSVFDGATRVYLSNVRKGSSGNASVSVPVTPGRVLRLVVGDAGNGNSYDQANWADARLTCAAPTAVTAPSPTAMPSAPTTAPSTPPPTTAPTSPSPSPVSLLTDGGAEAGTSGWSAGNAGLTRTTTGVRTGSGAFHLTAATTGQVLLHAPGALTVTGGISIRVSAWMKSATAAQQALVLVDWSSSTGYLSTAGTPQVTTSTTGWVEAAATLTVPDGAVRGSVYVKALDVPAGESLYVDDASVVKVEGATATGTSSPAPTTVSPAPTTAAVAPAPPPSGSTSTGPAGQAGTWTTIFADDFDGSALDATKWSDSEAWQRGGYVDTDSWNPSPATAQQIGVGAGALSLKARRGTNLPQAKPFTSAHINTRGKFSIPEGVTSYTEARIKAPSGRGLLPGFWLLGNGDSSTGDGWPINGEIDILEFANNLNEAGSPFWSLWFPKDVYTAAPGTFLNATHVYNTATAPKRPELLDSYHTWGLYRSPSQMDLFIDGVKIATFRPGEVHNDNIPLPAMLFTKPQHVRISLIVGGWGGAGYTHSQFQEGDLDVDYVKVWKQTGA